MCLYFVSDSGQSDRPKHVTEWYKCESVNVRVLCFVWSGTADDKLTHRDEVAQICVSWNVTDPNGTVYSVLSSVACRYKVLSIQ